MLDPRRTPIRIVHVMLEIGMFELEVTAFEDSGAHWSLPLEDVSGFQFEKHSQKADARQVSALEATIHRFSEDQPIDVDADAKAETEQRLAVEKDRSADWLTAHSDFLGVAEGLDVEASEGPVLLRAELMAYLDSLELGNIERSFSETWVSNPRSGEIVKAHQMVMARLGLAPYDGQILRDPRTLSGEWSQGRREEHILARLGFMRSLLTRLGIDTVVLYRGLTFERPPTDRRKPTLISTTFRHSVVEAWLDSDPMQYAANLIRQPVPIDRLFMTYLETEAMNSKFKEAEAVIFSEPHGILF